MGRVIYVSAPYEHKFAEIRQSRAMVATTYASLVWRVGLFAYSPLTHVHGMAAIDTNFRAVQMTRADDLNGFNLELLDACDELHVLRLPGWKTDDTVRQAMDRAKAGRVTRTFVTMEEIEKGVKWPEGHISKLLGTEEAARRIEKGTSET